MVRFNTVLLFVILGTSSALAAANADRGMVTVDGAMVYAKPDFDSKVIFYFRKGTKVVVSKSVVGAFRRVVVKKGVTGYISEVDVITRSAAQNKIVKGSKDSKQTKANHKQKPVAETRYVGLLIGLINYKEDLGNVKPASNETIYGVKITGPNLLLSGPQLLDLNLALHIGAPKYYAAGADITPTGFFIVLDTLMLLPVMDHPNTMAYLGIGPHLNYSQFNVIYQKGSYNLAELRIGAVGAVGWAFRMGNSLARLEYKYYWDQVKYPVVQLGVQLEF